jgi:hypothetical protein
MPEATSEKLAVRVPIADAPKDAPKDEPKAAPVVVDPSSPLWWPILAVYLALFLALGYFAFLQPDRNPVLDPRHTAAVARVSDAETKQLLLNTLREEGDEHDAKTDLAKQSFHVVLGALLGFLSASASGRRPRKRASAD